MYTAKEEEAYLGAAVASYPGQATCIRGIVHVTLRVRVRTHGLTGCSDDC